MFVLFLITCQSLPAVSLTNVIDLQKHLGKRQFG